MVECVPYRIVLYRILSSIIYLVGTYLDTYPEDQTTDSDSSLKPHCPPVHHSSSSLLVQWDPILDFIGIPHPLGIIPWLDVIRPTQPLLYRLNCVCTDYLQVL